MYLLDTDILIYSLKGDPVVIENLKHFASYPKAVSVVSYGELVFGAHHSQKVVENLAKVYRIKEIFPVIDISPAIMDTFGAMKAELRKEGTPIDDFDLLIGATALTRGYCVVTNNEKHFNQIQGLTVVNWARKQG